MGNLQKPGQKCAPKKGSPIGKVSKTNLTKGF